MSIRPIDMQVLIPRSTEVGVQQNNLAQQGVLQQQQFAEQMAKAAQLRQHQVQGLVKGQGGKIERDAKKENSNNKRQAEESEQHSNASSNEAFATDNGTTSPDPVLGHIIDIKT